MGKASAERRWRIERGRANGSGFVGHVLAGRRGGESPDVIFIPLEIGAGSLVIFAGAIAALIEQGFIGGAVGLLITILAALVTAFGVTWLGFTGMAVIGARPVLRIVRDTQRRSR